MSGGDGNRGAPRRQGGAPAEDGTALTDDTAGEAVNAPSVAADLPLTGIRIIDVGDVLASPHLASLLRQFGAEILTVDQPIVGGAKQARRTPTRCDEATRSRQPAGWSRRAVTIDLRRTHGVALFKRLIAKADVLIDALRPGAMETCGFGWDALSRINPGLILLRTSAAASARACTPSGRAWLMSAPWNATAASDTAPLGDYVTGLHSAIAVMAALQQREKTGCGQVIDAVLGEAMVDGMEETAGACAMTRRRAAASRPTLVIINGDRGGDTAIDPEARRAERPWPLRQDGQVPAATEDERHRPGAPIDAGLGEQRQKRVI